MSSTEHEDIEAQLRAETLDRLLSALTIHRKRGALDEAQRTLDAILELDPKNPDALEARADTLADQGRLEEALDEYRSILEDHPGRAHAEMMIAQISLTLAERKRLEAQQREILEEPEKMPRDRTARAVTCALILPGLGQLYLGHYLPGAALLLICLAAVGFLSDYGLARPFTQGYRSGNLGDIAATLVGYPFLIKFLLVLSLVAIVGAYVYGLIDTVRVARKQRQAVEEQLGVS